MNIFTFIYNSFLKFFGDIKVFKYPFFLLYDPGSYKVKGAEVRKVLDTVQDGDILIRGYTNYLDGLFIPGFFSHAGLYLGDTTSHNFLLPDVIASKFYKGKQAVIHSMAEGVFMEDLINFCKCDYLVILRRNNTIEPQLDLLASSKVVFETAIKNLGKGYDFKFDFANIGNLSCTELVFNCCADVFPLYDVDLKPRRIMLRKRNVLIPDDFVTQKFDLVFKSASVQQKVLEKIFTRNAK
ncbi:MAG: hypothetical protein IPM34_00850 [Saprospiraceae bacterium]|nr:hypothetical protein [Saprospiraceae bacterium]